MFRVFCTFSKFPLNFFKIYFMFFYIVFPNVPYSILKYSLNFLRSLINFPGHYFRVRFSSFLRISQWFSKFYQRFFPKLPYSSINQSLIHHFRTIKNFIDLVHRWQNYYVLPESYFLCFVTWKKIYHGSSRTISSYDWIIKLIFRGRPIENYQFSIFSRDSVEKSFENGSQYNWRIDFKWSTIYDRMEKSIFLRPVNGKWSISD